MDSSPVSAGTIYSPSNSRRPGTVFSWSTLSAPSVSQVSAQTRPRVDHPLTRCERRVVMGLNQPKIGIYHDAKTIYIYIYIIFNILISHHHRKPSINLDSKGNPAVFLRIWMRGKRNPMGWLVGSLQHPQKTDRKVMILDDGNQENPENKSRRVP